MLLKTFAKNLLQVKYPLLNPIYRKWQQKNRGAIGNVYMLHRVSDFETGRLYPNENMKVSPKFIEKIILKYRKHGFDFLSLDELYSLLKSKKKPKKPFIVFTLDDGYLDNYTTAYPIFKKYNIPFTIYVATDFPDRKAILWWYALEDYLLERESVELGNGELLLTRTVEEKNTAFMYIRSIILKFDKKDFVKQFNDLLKSNLDLSVYVSKLAMSWGQIMQLAKDPLCTIGGHSVTHPAFNTLMEEELLAEVKNGCERLSEYIGETICHFAYPFGSPNEVEEREFLLTEKVGFETIVTTYGGTVNLNTNPCRLPRTMLCEL